jgi:hypothetical protein
MVNAVSLSPELVKAILIAERVPSQTWVIPATNAAAGVLLIGKNDRGEIVLQWESTSTNCRPD